jgi:aminobenzoyl-glutamate utilization protein A
MGEALGAESDSGLMTIASRAARKAGYERIIDTPLPLGGSEDFSFMMDRVTRHGGKALYMVFGTNLKDAHHAPLFDIVEQDLPAAALTFLNLAGMLS